MEIFSAIPSELALLRDSLLMGAAFFMLYDLIRILRRIFPHGIIWISLEDCLYWAAAGGWFFLTCCRANNGIIRFYMLFAMAASALLYYMLFSRFIMKYLSIFILSVKKRLKKIHKLITMKIAEKITKSKRHEDGSE